MAEEPTASRDVVVKVCGPATATAKAHPPTVEVELLLNAARLAVLGLLVSVGLGAAGVALTLDKNGRVGAGVGLCSFVLSCILLRVRSTRRLLAWFAKLVLPQPDEDRSARVDSKA